MKTFKEKKGFTLIELLAVIVVLAIVMVLAVTTVLPLLSSSRKQAFILEANNAKETTSQIMSLIAIDVTEDLNLSTGNDYQASADGTKKCFTLKKLAETQLYKKDAKYFDGPNPEYAGKIVVTTEGETNRYTYTIYMRNKSLYINGAKGTVVETDVNSYAQESDISGIEFNCKPSDVGISG